MQIVHMNDLGTEIELTIADEVGAVVDLTGATVALHFQRPDGATVQKAGQVKTPATGGRVAYATEDGFLVVAGSWKLRARVVKQAGVVEFWTTPFVFTVARAG